METKPKPKPKSNQNQKASSLLLSVVAFVSIYCMHLLVKVAELSDSLNNGQKSGTESPLPSINILNNNNNETSNHDHNTTTTNNNRRVLITFPDLGALAYGPRGRTAVVIILTGCQLGFLIAYVSFIANNMHDSVSGVSIRLWILIISPLLWLLSQVRQIKYLTSTNMLGNILYLSAVATVIIHGFADDCCLSSSQIVLVKWSGVPLCFGTLTFALEGIAAVLPIRSTLRNQESFPTVMYITVGCVVALYFLFAFLCYLFFGEETNSVITINLGSGAVATLVKTCLCISILMTYGIQLFPINEMFDTWIDRWTAMEEEKSINALDAMLPYQTTTVASSKSRDSTSPLLSASLSPSPSPPLRTTFTPASDTPTSSSSSSSSVSVLMPSSEMVVAAASNQKNANASRTQTARVETPLLDSTSEPSSSSSSSAWLAFCRAHTGLVKTLFRTLIVLVSISLPLIYSDFGIVVSLSGSLFVCALVFIIPSIAYAKLCAPPNLVGYNKFKFYVAPITIIVVGLMASCIGIYSAIHDIIN